MKSIHTDLVFSFTEDKFLVADSSGAITSVENFLNLYAQNKKCGISQWTVPVPNGGKKLEAKNRIVNYDSHSLIFFHKILYDFPKVWLLDLKTGIWTQKTRLSLPDPDELNPTTDSFNLLQLDFEGGQMLMHEDKIRVTLIGGRQLSILNLETGVLEGCVYHSLSVGYYERQKYSDFITFHRTRDKDVFWFLGSLKEEECCQWNQNVARFRFIAGINISLAQKYFDPGMSPDDIKESTETYGYLHHFEANKLDELTIMAIYRFENFYLLLKIQEGSQFAKKVNLRLENCEFEQKFELEDSSLRMIAEWKVLIGLEKQTSSREQKSTIFVAVDLTTYEILGRFEAELSYDRLNLNKYQRLGEKGEDQGFRNLYLMSAEYIRSIKSGENICHVKVKKEASGDIRFEIGNQKKTTEI